MGVAAQTKNALSRDGLVRVHSVIPSLYGRFEAEARSVSAKGGQIWKVN